MNESIDIKDFIIQLEEWAILSMDFNNSDTKKCNEMIKDIHKMFKALREANRLEELKPFLDHGDKVVSNKIATYYLVQDEELAIQKLEELSKEEGLIGAGSKSNLEEWRKGNLHFDY